MLGDADPTLEGLAKEFENQNPDADFKITPIPWEAAHDKLATAIAGGNGPDRHLLVELTAALERPVHVPCAVTASAL